MQRYQRVQLQDCQRTDGYEPRWPPSPLSTLHAPPDRRSPRASNQKINRACVLARRCRANYLVLERLVVRDSVPDNADPRGDRSGRVIGQPTRNPPVPTSRLSEPPYLRTPCRGERIDRRMTVQLQRAIDLTESRTRWYRLRISVKTVSRRADAPRALSCGEQDRSASVLSGTGYEGSFPVLSSGLILIKLDSCETLHYERFSNTRREIDAKCVLSLWTFT